MPNWPPQEFRMVVDTSDFRTGALIFWAVSAGISLAADTRPILRDNMAVVRSDDRKEISKNQSA